MTAIAEKIKSREEIASLCAAGKKGAKIVYTSGVFDLLHAGHTEYLEKSKALGDILVVGVNSDSSVKSYKGKDRPINPQMDRAKVVASLAPVDFVFIFDERNNNRNIEILKPAIYVKAGDYKQSELSSAPIVESYGGRVEVIPMLEGRSTSSVIEKISAAARHEAGEEIPYGRAPALFVDRDGTIIEHVEYLHEPEKMKIIPGALETLKSIRAKGYRIIIVTHQPGIGLGYFTKEQFFAVNRELFKAASKVGLNIDRVYFCPHGKGDECRCRKPGTLLIEKAAADMNLDLSRSFVAGDMTSDIALGRNSGMRTILVETGRAGKDGLFEAKPDYTIPSIAEAASVIPDAPKETTPAGVSAEQEGEPDALSTEALEAIGKICGKIGHDFNNLLGSIMGCVDLIENRMKKTFPEGSPIARQTSIIYSAIQRGLDMTTRIRGFVRPGALSASRASLKQVVDDTVSLLRKSSALPFDVVFECRANPNVEINEFMIGQMLMAIFMNSIEGMKANEERYILIYLDETSDPVQAAGGNKCALLGIVDHGRGMSEMVKERLFEPFFSTKQAAIGQGIGLSLTMAKEVMRKHKGLIEIDSIKGVGTRVQLFFPLAK